MPDRIRVDRVDEVGVHLTAREDLVVDVQFDGRRIWSFWTLRDTSEERAGLVAEWPSMLKRFLKGTTRLSVVEHVSGEVAYDEELRLGDKDQRIAIVDAKGRPLGIDKSNRISTMFDTRDDEHVKPLLDSTEEVLAALHEAGVEAFPAYGTLLGAIREQDFIGHDNDVDLGYVSRHTHPLDVVRESFRLQRRLRERGYAVDRYSAAAFKVDVVEADGGVRGLDVFGGYFLDGRLYLMGEIGTPFEEDWIFPLGTCTLAGRTLPAPARPEKLLEATYGPGWKVPDPAFHFETPRTTYRRLNGWFRGGRAMRNEWDRRFSMLRQKLPKVLPSGLARHVAEQEPGLAQLVDVGAGRGADALWFARQGVPTLALDFARSAADPVRRAAAEDGSPLELGWMSLNEPRSVLAWGARVARLDGPRVVMANHLLDAVDRTALDEFARFARMALSGGGRLYADFYTLEPGEERYLPRGRNDWMKPKSADRVSQALEAAGAVIVHSTQVEATTGRREFAKSDRPVVRMVAEWRK
ncbi:MAG: LicD family protein [Marmoricola sp.]